MNNKIELAYGRCIISPEQSDIELYTVNGLFKGNSKSSKIKRGTVVMVHEDEDIIKAGDLVFYQGKGSPIVYDGVECMNMSIDSVEGIISTT